MGCVISRGSFREEPVVIWFPAGGPREPDDLTIGRIGTQGLMPIRFQTNKPAACTKLYMRKGISIRPCAF